MTTADLDNLNKIESFFLRGYYPIYNMMVTNLTKALHDRLEADGYSVKVHDKNVLVQITKK